MSDKPNSGGGGRRFPMSKWAEDFESNFIENDPVKAEAMNARDREVASPEPAFVKGKSKGKGKQVILASPATASSSKAPVAASSTSDEESEDGEQDKRAEAARRWPNVKQSLADSTCLKSYVREGFDSKKDAQDFIAFRKKWFPLGGKSKKTTPSTGTKDDNDEDMEVDEPIPASSPASTGHSQHKAKGKGKAPASRG